MKLNKKKKKKNVVGSGGIRTHASEETGALNQRLRPLGHATMLEILSDEHTDIPVYALLIAEVILVFVVFSLITTATV